MSARTRALIVLQARLGSRRLPGKVLAPIEGTPLLAYCITRLVAAGVGDVVVATTTEPEDAAVLALATTMRVAAHPGPVDDVLGRYGEVADRYPEARLILRATGDNPLVDIDAPARVLKALDAGADYAVEEALPVGTAVEGVRRDVLLLARSEATSAYDREHVTPWIRRAGTVARATPLAPPAIQAPDLRFTVDTPDDLAYVQRIAGLAQAAGADPRRASLATFIDIARRLPVRGPA